MANILLLGSGTQAYAIIKPLKDDKHTVYILTSETTNYGDKSRFVKEVIRTSVSPNDNDYLVQVKNLLMSRDIEVIIPMGDSAAEFLSKNKVELSSICRLQIPDYFIFRKGYDKNELMTLCKNNGYPHPYTIDLSIDGLNSQEIDSFPYPGILKPNCTTGGRGMVIISDAEQLKDVYPSIRLKYGECHLQRFVKSGGKQIKVQLYINEQGDLLGHSVLDKVRWYPIKGGSSCCSVTIENKSLTNICYNILRKINWIGFADFDIIEDPETNELLIMEINPRLPACIGAAICAGVNWPQIIVNDSLGLPSKEYSYTLGIIFRHLGLDALWFMKSEKRFKVKPSWFRFLGRDVYYQDFHFNDQKPFWMGTWHNIMNLFKKDYRQNKTMNTYGNK